MIHVYASQPNYWRHLAPLVDELRSRGHDVETWAHRGWQPWGQKITDSVFRNPEFVIVASWLDAHRARRSPVVYVEHGAGQTYIEGDTKGYAGAPNLEHVRLFLTPSEHVADRWRAAYPETPAEAVGCPALDCHMSGRDSTTNVANPPTVVLSSHWWCGINPETMPALPLFADALRTMVRGPWTMLGHAHPRAARRTMKFWDDLGIAVELDPDRVLETADLLVHDNSSLMYEAAALDIPVLALNAPTYRRDVEHGLRFWSHVPGIQCNSVGTFIPAVMAALDDPPEAALLRARAAAHVYAHRDGDSSQRAVDAIERVL